MTDAMAAPGRIVAPGFTLRLLGDPGAAVCEGEVCVIPDHHQQAIVNRWIDDDAI
ncbi:MAG: hypothetical protein LH471_08110 [Salinibacterium sp.]|nr:hypothetical protein [Salinibacterium sp.]